MRNTSLKIIRLWLFTCCTLTLVSCGIETPQSTNEVASMQPRELEWSELMPKDYDPNRVIADVDISEFSDITVTGDALPIFDSASTATDAAYSARLSKRRLRRPLGISVGQAASRLA